ncbi:MULTISPECIES: FecR domain-containing protein [Niastella]|uniref:FecR domain-containing protein n=1 Tax=Niastella soli TaxID=2821487 RepID=A0ABS3YTL8_9BACT|nr:FecR domain-containing protein [Niastella soli]MBO9201261.1 FecR domain-containing protein [Niastella soli]
MKSYTQHMDDLLVKHITGEATAAEALEVEKWLADDEANKHYFEHFKLIWEESVQLATTTQIDEQAAWKRFQNRVQEGSFTPQKARIWSLNSPALRAAVITGLVIGIAALTYFLFHNNPGNVLAMATIQANNQVKSDSLPDGSIVTLNKHSQVSFPEKFTNDKRVLQLNGEAFFKVKPDKKKPFEVHTNNVTITVVGTSFNVRSRGDTTEIIVETGLVEVTTDKQTVLLKAGQKAITGISEDILQKQSNTDQLYNYYRSKKFVCENTPLWKLVDKLNEAYEVQIIFGKQELRDLPLTTTFDNEPLDKILNILSTTFNISVVKEKGQIILR